MVEVDAADIIGRNPTTLQLRYLQTLREIGATQNTTVVFPMPIDLVKPVLDAIQSGQASASVQTPPAPPAPPANGAIGPAESRALGPGAEAPAATPSPASPDAAPVEREE